MMNQTMTRVLASVGAGAAIGALMVVPAQAAYQQLTAEVGTVSQAHDDLQQAQPSGAPTPQAPRTAVCPPPIPVDADGKPLPPPEGFPPLPPVGKDGKPLPPPTGKDGKPLPPPTGKDGKPLPPPTDQDGKPLPPPEGFPPPPPLGKDGKPLPPPTDKDGRLLPPPGCSVK